MSITEQQLQRIMPNARRQAGVFVSALNAAMTNRKIDTREAPGSVPRPDRP